MEGVTYGVSSWHAHTRFDAYMTVQAAIDGREVARAIDEMLKAANQMRESDVTTEEIERVRNTEMMNAPLAFETRAGILAELESLAYFGLPDDHAAKLAKRLEPIDPGTIRVVSSKYLTADALRFVVVGDAVTTLPMLRALTTTGALAGASLEVVDANGVVR